MKVVRLGGLQGFARYANGSSLVEGDHELACHTLAVRSFLSSILDAVPNCLFSFLAPTSTVVSQRLPRFRLQLNGKSCISQETTDSAVAMAF